VTAPPAPYALARSAQSAWSALTVAERAARLAPAMQALSDRMDAYAALIHEENGKPMVEAVTHEVAASIGYLEWLLREAPRLLADEDVALRVFPHRRATLQRVPWGVVLVIGPWNVPLFIPVSQVMPALIAGNAVVLKPSEVTPRCAGILAEILGACDLPQGLFAVVEGDGAVGAALIEARPDKIQFTGSVATGRKVMAAAAAHPVPVTLELGGVDAMIVCADADLEFAASAAAWGATFNGGQVCASVERLIVHSSIRDRFLTLLADKLERIDPRGDLGPITSPVQRAVYEAHLADARARGLATPVGGDFLGPERLAPTLITGPGITGAAVWREETFGPVVAAAGFDTDDEAVSLHNGIASGLTASVFSADVGRARRIAGRLRAGLVSINDVGATLYSQAELPWGGVGASGFGRSHGAEGLLDCTWSRIIEAPRVGVWGPKRPWWYPYGEDQRALLEAFGRALAARGARGRLRQVARAGGALAAMLTRAPRL